MTHSMAQSFERLVFVSERMSFSLELVISHNFLDFLHGFALMI